jgi:7,8-dihydropterin-6-yl-methyl-4-(beta-D-ribofuranosyl)aminobenzene 5'-phosphate synthase
MKITMLAENRLAPGVTGLKAEPGLSTLIETQAGKILFDTGSSGVFIENAAQLGVSLEDVNLVVISHGHGDHGGGLPRFLAQNTHCKVFMRRRADLEYYVRMIFFNANVQVPPQVFSEYADRIQFIDEATEILPGVYLLTDIPRRYPLVAFTRNLLKKEHGRLIPDPLDHELVLVVRENDGLVVFTGCSHNGAINMIEAARAKFPGLPVKAVIGGFHLVGIPVVNLQGESQAKVHALGQALLDLNIEKIDTCHCTGLKSYAWLKEVLGDKINYLATGSTIER